MSDEINLQQLRNENPDEKIVVHKGILDGKYEVQITYVGEFERTAVIIWKPGEPKELVRMDRLVVKFEDVELVTDAEVLAKKMKGQKGGIGRWKANRRKINAEGAAAKRRKLKLSETRDMVRKRRKCDSCGAPSTYKLAQHHHVFGRGNKIPQEFADSPELGACLHKPCHDYVQTHPNSEEDIKLKWKAINRFAYRYRLDWTPYRDAGWTPLQTISDLIRVVQGEEATLGRESYNPDTDTNVA